MKHPDNAPLTSGTNTENAMWIAVAALDQGIQIFRRKGTGHGRRGLHRVRIMLPDVIAGKPSGRSRSDSDRLETAQCPEDLVTLCNLGLRDRAETVHAERLDIEAGDNASFDNSLLEVFKRDLLLLRKVGV